VRTNKDKIEQLHQQFPEEATKRFAADDMKFEGEWYITGE
jgi:hypothetical protein